MVVSTQTTCHTVIAGGLDAAVQRELGVVPNFPVSEVSAAISKTFVVIVHRGRLGKSAPNAFPKHNDKVISGARRHMMTKS
jgi:hypothetical protein